MHLCSVYGADHLEILLLKSLNPTTLPYGHGVDGPRRVIFAAAQKRLRPHALDDGIKKATLCLLLFLGVYVVSNRI